MMSDAYTTLTLREFRREFHQVQNIIKILHVEIHHAQNNFEHDELILSLMRVDLMILNDIYKAIPFKDLIHEKPI